MERKNPLKPYLKIAVVGPESCGKTTLARQLSVLLDGYLVEEFARAYLFQHGPEYSLETLVNINREQLQLEKRALESGKKWIFCDTTPLVIEIWAQEVFGTVPEAISKSHDPQSYDYYLLCAADLPWEPDPLRENPNDRDRLFEVYLNQIKGYRLNYTIVKGLGHERLSTAFLALKTYFKL